METPTSSTGSRSATGHLLLSSMAMLGFACMQLPVQAQTIDAGGQANLMQQHTMMRNQSTGDGPDWVDREALRRKHGGKVLPGSRGIPEPAAAVEGAAADRALLAHDMKRAMERRRAELRPEYERRVRHDGQESTDRWLRDVAAEMGRRDGEAAKGRYGK